MPRNVIDIAVLVKTDGLDKGAAQASKLADNFERASAAANSTSKAISAANKATATASNANINEKDYDKVRGAVGTGAAGRDFAKQAQGLGGVVSLYATFAANIFAVGAAYEALNKAAAADRLAEATKRMSVQVGVNLKSISNSLVTASGQALSFQDALQFTNIGTSAGLAGKQIESLTKIARGAASALGRDVNDSIRRIIQGTAKQEQEILDELGIFVKSKQAFDRYAKEIGVKVEDLTGIQRTQAYANEVERLGAKWATFAEIEDPFSKFAATGKNALNDLLTSINKLVAPTLDFLASTKEGLTGIIILVATMLSKRALPEVGKVISNIFTFDKQLVISRAIEARIAITNELATLEARALATKKAIEATKVSAVDSSSITTGMLVTPHTKGPSTDISAIKLANSFNKDPTVYATIAESEKSTLNIMKEQIRAAKDKDALLSSLIDKGRLSNISTLDNLVLSKKGEDIAQAMNGKALEAIALEKQKITYAEIEVALASKKLELEKAGGSLSSAQVYKTRLSTAKDTINTTASEASRAIDTAIPQGFSLFNTKVAGATFSGIMDIARATSAAITELHGMSAVMLVAASATNILGIALKGIFAFLGPIAMGLTTLYTIWSIFGDTIKKYIPEQVLAVFHADKASVAAENAAEKQKQYAESLVISTKNLGLLNDMHASGKIDSIAEEASISERLSKNLREQLSTLQGKKEATIELAAYTARRDEGERLYGKSLSENYLNLKELAISLDKIGKSDLSVAANKLANAYQEVNSRKELGLINEAEYTKQLLTLDERHLKLVMEASTTTAQNDASFGVLQASLNVLNDLTDKAITKQRSLGDTGKNLTSGNAVSYFSALSAELTNSFVSTKGLDGVWESLGKSIQEGGKLASLALPVWEEVANLMDLLSKTTLTLGEKQAVISQYMSGSAAAIAYSNAIGTTTDTSNKVSEYSKLIKKLNEDIAKSSSEAEGAQNGYNKSQQDFLTLAASPEWKKFTNEQRSHVAILFEQKVIQESINEGIRVHKSLTLESEGLSADFAKTQASLAAKFGKDSNLEEYTKDMELLIKQQPYMIKATKDSESAADSYNKSLIALQSTGANTSEALTKAIVDQELHNAEIGKTKAEVELAKQAEHDLTTELLANNANILEASIRTATVQKDFDEQTLTLWNAKLISLREEVNLRNILSNKLATGAKLEEVDALRKANKKAAEASSKYWEDALMRAFESGKGFFQSLWDTIKNTLKTQVLKVMVSATGLTGMTAATAGETGISALEQGSTLLSLTEKVGRLASVFNGSGLTAFAQSGIGNALGLSTTDATVQSANAAAAVANGATSTAAIDAASLTKAGNAFAGMPLGGIVTAYTMGGVKGFAAGVASTALAGGVAASIAGTGFMAGAAGTLTAIGPWGWAAMGAAALLGMGNDGPHAIGTGEASATFDAAGKRIGSTAYAPFGGSNASTEGVLTGLQATYAAQAAAIGIKTAQATFGTGSNVASDGSYRNFAISATVGESSYRSGETAYSEEALKLEASRAVFMALQGSDIPKYLQGAFDGLSAASMTQAQIDAWMQGAQAIKGFNDAMQVTPWENFKSLTYATIQNLAGFAGGIDKLQASLGTFYENFYTSDVKTANLLSSTTKAFEALGITMPAIDGATRDWYRGVVEAQLALDQNIPGNAAATSGLLALQSAVNQLAPAFVTAAQAAKLATKSAYDALTKAIDAEKARVQITIGLAQEQVTAITSVFDTLKSNVSSLYASVSSTASTSAAQGNAFITQALTTAQSTGYLPDNTQLADAISASRGGIDAAVYASQQDADFARLELAGRLDQLKTISGDQLTGAEKALKVAQDQLTALDLMATNAKAQLDALDGISGMVLSIGEAMGAFNKAVAAAAGSTAPSGNVTVGGGGVGSAPDHSAGYRSETYLGAGYGSVFSAITDPGQVARFDSIAAYINKVGVGSTDAIKQIADAAAMYGVSQQDIASATGYLLKDVQAVFAGAGIPAFAQGTNFVPSDMLAQIHQGEAIVPAAYNPANGGVGNTARLEALVVELLAKVAALEGAANRTANAIEGNQNRPILVEIA